MADAPMRISCYSELSAMIEYKLCMVILHTFLRAHTYTGIGFSALSISVRFRSRSRSPCSPLLEEHKRFLPLNEVSDTQQEEHTSFLLQPRTELS